MMGTRRFLTGLARETNFRADDATWLRKTGEGRSINNLWTGKELGKKGNAAFATLGVGYVGYSGLTAGGKANQAEVDYQVETEGVQSLAGTRGDGAGYQMPNAPTGFQPSGDLVFALNRLRHGG